MRQTKLPDTPPMVPARDFDYNLIVVQSTVSKCLSLSGLCIIPLDDELGAPVSARGWPHRIATRVWLTLGALCRVVAGGLWSAVIARDDERRWNVSISTPHQFLFAARRRRRAPDILHTPPLIGGV